MLHQLAHTTTSTTLEAACVDTQQTSCKQTAHHMIDAQRDAAALQLLQQPPPTTNMVQSVSFSAAGSGWAARCCAALLKGFTQ